MSLFKKLFGERSQLKFRRKELQELADGVLSEALLIQELTTAKAAAFVGGLIPQPFYSSVHAAPLGQLRR